MDTSPPPKKLLDQMRDALRVKHYALSTENSYVDWAERFIRFHHMRHPSTMGETEIAASRSVTHLAVEENIAAPTQSQALSAILFLYRHVLHRELDGRIDLVRAKKSRHLPVVLTKAEVQAVLRHVPSEYQMMAKLLYGSGLRLMECVRLRVKHVLSLPKETWTSSSARSWCAMAKA
jgi:site-specific recombinase XerD